MTLDAEFTILRLERGCPSPHGCGCLGTCHELIEVVPLAEAMRMQGERDALRGWLERVNAMGEGAA